MNKTGSYRHTNQKSIDRFMKGGKGAKPKEESDDEETMEQEHFEGEAKLEGLFAVVDPIPTVVGPIGRFQLSEETFPTHPAVIAFGKRRTGKTFTFRWLMYNCFRQIPFGIVLSNTAQNGFWQQYVPSNYVYKGLDMGVVNTLIKRQEKLTNEFKKAHPDLPADAYKNEPSIAAFIVLGKYIDS